MVLVSKLAATFDFFSGSSASRAVERAADLDVCTMADLHAVDFAISDETGP